MSPGPSGGIAFLDTETVTLRRGPDVMWEIALILRDEPGNPQGSDVEWRFQLRPNMGKAQPKALEISGYHERFVVPDGVDALGWSPVNLMAEPARMTHSGVAAALAVLLAGRHVIGAVPSFDTERISLYGQRHGAWSEDRDPWHYHLADVENMAVGYLSGLHFGGAWDPGDLQPPWSSDALSHQVGIDPPGPGVRHTALGDARWVRSLYDVILDDTEPPQQPVPTVQPVPPAKPKHTSPGWRV